MICGSASRLSRPSNSPELIERAVAGVRQLGVLAAVHDRPDLEAELPRELVVALVVRGHRHDRAGAVLHQHVVGHVHRDLLAVDRVGHGRVQRHAGLLLVVGPALLGRLDGGAAHVLGHLGRVAQAQHVRVLGRHDEEGRSEQGVRAGGEHLVVGVQGGAVELDLRALGAADPVALHGHHVLGPLDGLQVVQQPVGVVGDAEEPLLQLAHLDQRARALAAPVDDLLVGQHGLLDRVPVDRRLVAVGQALLEQAQEQPLGPAVVLGLVGAELPRPVDRHAPAAELALELGDRGLGGLTWVLAGADGVVLGRQAERVVAQRVQDPVAVAAAEVRDRVADGVDLQVPDVGLARGVGQHLEHVALGPPVVLVGDLPGALVGPHLLPAGLDLPGVVAVVHPRENRVGRWRSGLRYPRAWRWPSSARAGAASRCC